MLANAPVNGYLYAFPYCMKRMLLLLSLGLFVWLVPGCSKHAPWYYSITDLHIYNEDNSGADPVDASTADIPAKAYAIRLEFTNQLYDSLSGHDDESSYYVLNGVKSFRITSLTDFDNLHPAGSSLNDYFLLGTQSAHVTVKDSLATHVGYIGVRNITQYGTPPDSWTVNNYLVLMKPPAFLGNRSFVIHLGFADNTNWTDTIHVNLLP